MFSATAITSSRVLPVPNCGHVTLSLSKILPNFSRSSAKSIFLGDVPIIGTPALAKSLAIFNGVCPPN